MKHAIKLIPAALLASSMGAQAVVMITMQEVDGDVVLIGSGAVDTLNGLTASGIEWGAEQHGIYGGDTIITTENDLPIKGGLVAPSDFVVKINAVATAFSGSDFSVGSSGLALPESYIPGSPIKFEMIFEGDTFDAFGVHEGTYEWTWGTADNGDFVRLCIGDHEPCAQPEPPTPITTTPVPALGAFGLMGLAGAIGAAGVAMNRRRKQ